MITSVKATASLGKATQLGFIVRDIDAALHYWTEVIGAGPFFRGKHMTLGETLYRGEPSDIHFTAAFGWWGDVQVELIQQLNDSPSLYLDWLREGREGIQHIGVVVDDFDKAYSRLKSGGGVALQESVIPGGVRAAYFEMPKDSSGPFVELLKVPQPLLDLWGQWQHIAAQWDGVTDPVREFSRPHQH